MFEVKARTKLQKTLGLILVRKQTCFEFPNHFKLFRFKSISMSDDPEQQSVPIEPIDEVINEVEEKECDLEVSNLTRFGFQAHHSNTY